MDNIRQPPVDLRQLAYFVAIADAGTVSGAAAKIGISQPSLSEVLVRLERYFNVQLVIRSARGIQLTEAGAMLARYGREILQNVDLAVSEIRQLGSNARGPVAIGLPPSVALMLSVPLAETVRHEMPEIKLRIGEALSGHILEWVLSEKIDIGVIYQGLDCRHVASQPLLTEEMFLVSAADNWPIEKRNNDGTIMPIDFGMLAELPLILTSRSHGLRELIERHARSLNVNLNVVLEVDALRHIVSIVSRASGYTVLSHAAVMDEVDRGELILIPIVNPTIHRTAYLVRKQSRPITRASLTVERTLSTILRELIDRHKLRATIPTVA